MCFGLVPNLGMIKTWPDNKTILEICTYSQRRWAQIIIYQKKEPRKVTSLTWSGFCKVASASCMDNLCWILGQMKFLKAPLKALATNPRWVYYPLKINIFDIGANCLYYISPYYHYYYPLIIKYIWDSPSSLRSAVLNTWKLLQDQSNVWIRSWNIFMVWWQFQCPSLPVCWTTSTSQL